MRKLIILYLLFCCVSCGSKKVEVSVVEMNLVDSFQSYRSSLNGEEISVTGLMRFTLKSSENLHKTAKEKGLNLWAKASLCETKKPLKYWSTIFQKENSDEEFYVFVWQESDDSNYQYIIDDLKQGICFDVGAGNMLPNNNITSDKASYTLNPKDVALLNTYKKEGKKSELNTNMFDIDK